MSVAQNIMRILSCASIFKRREMSVQIGGALARDEEVRFRREIALSVAEHAAYLEEYGSLGDAVRAMGPGDDDSG